MKTDGYKVGDSFTYPRHSRWLVEVPEDLAIDWVDRVCPHAILGPMTDDTAVLVKSKNAKWLNKLAVVIEDDRGVLALYKHDFKVWLIELQA